MAVVNDGLNDEQLSRKSVSTESVDGSGLVNRQRVSGQTIFDVMLIEYYIEYAQHEAAHLFMEALSVSGASIPSLDPSVEGRPERHTVGDRMSEKRMIFSGAYRSMSNSVSSDVCRIVMQMCHDPYTYSAETAEATAAFIHDGLWSLAKHYKIYDKRDPRRIISAQVYCP